MKFFRARTYVLEFCFRRRGLLQICYTTLDNVTFCYRHAPGVLTITDQKGF
jgi:hypothetical protein